MTTCLLKRNITKQRSVGRGRPILNNGSFDLEPMEGDSGVSAISLPDGMRHCRHHRAGQSHAIEFYHRSFLQKGRKFKNPRGFGGGFEYPDRKHALGIGFRQGGRIDFDWFTAVSRKNAIIHRSWITPRCIEYQVRIVAWLFFPLPIDVICLAKHGSCLQANLVVSADRSFKFVKTVVKRSISSAKNSGGCLFLRLSLLVLFIKIVDVYELNCIRDYPALDVLIT